MTRPIRVIKPAAEEFTDAVRWYEAKRRGLGAQLFDAVVASFDLITSHPEAGTAAFGDAETRRTLVTRFPFQVVYRLEPSEIVIIAIAHLKRRPEFWKHRR